jgi:hypothetical protein
MTRSISALVWICLSAVAAAQPSWLPPEVEDGAAHQLATRVAEIGAGKTDETRLSGARRLVSQLRERLESWGEKGTVDRAPRFPDLRVPESERPSLDAIARYQVCNMVLMIQLQDPSFADDADAKMTSVTGLTAFTLAVLYLRQPFLGAGGSDEELQAFLTSSSMESVLKKIQTEPGARAQVETQCSPPLQALLQP